MIRGIKSCRVFRFFAGLLAVALVFFTACAEFSSEEQGEGLLHLSFGKDYKLLTRAGLQIPDTCDFRLCVKHSSGETIYDGKYGQAPEVMKVRAGSCTVSVMSGPFDTPVFDGPQFGDQQCVVVPNEGAVSVRLVCRQINCGVRLKVAKEFLTECPQSILFLKSAKGRLMYSYSEKRYGYFSPGSLSLVMVTGENEQTLFTRNLFSGEMLTLGVSVSQSGSSAGGGSSSGNEPLPEGITMTLDTARVWTDASCVIGGKPGSGSGGGSGGVTDGGAGSEDPQAKAMTVAEAKSSVGSSGVWVSAYVVGGNLTSSSARYDPPFTSRSNLLIGPRSTIVDRSSGMSVQLQAGKVRDALNLVDNPHVLGRKVLLKGDVVDAYYGMVGLKNITDYRLL